MGEDVRQVFVNQRAESEEHSRMHAARMLDQPNYPTNYEWERLLYDQSNWYDYKMVLNLRAMLAEARNGGEAT